MQKDNSKYQTIEHIFEPVYDENSRILILGSLPSVKSRENHFYYGHPQNRFWKLLAALYQRQEMSGTRASVKTETKEIEEKKTETRETETKIAETTITEAKTKTKIKEAVTEETEIKTTSAPQTIEEKKSFLHRHHIAVWDVIAQCDIIGSSDSSIKNVIPNDMHKIIDHAPIERIYANGGKAFDLYMKYCYPACEREIIKLPSTSPANAAFSMDKLIEAWSVIME